MSALATEIPLGLCQCGCGERTNIAPNTSPRLGRVKGQPYRFLHGHNGRNHAPLAARLEPNIDFGDGTGCWIWTGARSPLGYGAVSCGGGVTRRAHRATYELLVGPIPEGMQLDHVKARGCTSTACVNPAHLEPVTNAENTRRGARAKITMEIAEQIRQRRAAGEMVLSIAAAYGIAESTVSNIVHGRRWATC